MGVPFDHIATSYDSSFSHSPIGQLQRRQVWNYLQAVTLQLQGLDILELNFGTGEDADLFSEKGFNIVATDISEEMLKITQEKVQQFSMQNKISSQYLDLDSFDDSLFEKKFDLIFSNFGGLNCINPESLQKLLSRIPAILSPHGRFIGVIMPPLCAWETAYFFTKFNFKNAFRRLSKKANDPDLFKSSAKTWYYSPSQIRKWADKFSVVNTKPIGIALPPSYLHSFFYKHRRLLISLNRLEKKLNKWSFLSSFSDFYLIDLRLNQGKV